MSAIPDTQKNGCQLFYCNGKISTEINGDARWRFLQANDLILAQNNHKTPGLPSRLAACDQQRSVFSMYEEKSSESYAYSPYGHHTQGGLLSLLAFNGERRDTVTGHYHLGNGYRQFSPVMMRFSSPDSWSPFGDGGLNAYVYCAGDPSNRSDPTGHAGARGLIVRKLNPRKPNERPSPEVVKPTVLASKKYINKRDGSGGAIPRAVAKVGDTVPFESLFNSSEIAEQHRLIAQFSAPANASSKTKQVYVQSHGAVQDADAAKRYAQSLDAHKVLLENENKVRELAALLTDLDAVNSRLSGAGSSRDIMIQAALQEEIRTRLG